MLMDLQKFNEQDPKEPKEPKKEPEKSGDNDNENSNKRLSNTVNQLQGLVKDLLNKDKGEKGNTGKPKEPAEPEKEPKEPESEKGNGEAEPNPEKDRIDKLEKLVKQQQDRLDHDNLTDYTKSQLRQNNLNVDDETFKRLQGDTKEKTDSNVKWFKNLSNQFNKPPKQPNTGENGKPKQDNLGADLAKGSNKPKGLSSYF